MSDIYCFICGHYLSDAWAITNKNKKIFVGDHNSGNQFSKTTVDKNEEKTVEYEYDGSDILYHGECYDVLKQRCKYALKYGDVIENREDINSHGLIPYDDIERPPNANDIRRIHRWSEDQIVEEWIPIIDEIRTKNVELKKQKKEVLQSKREARRAFLREKFKKMQDKTSAEMLKIPKMQAEFDKIKNDYDKKIEELETVKENPQKKRLKIIRLEKSIEKLEERMNKSKASLDKFKKKVSDMNEDNKLFEKAWF
jgi:hypothetical protein